MCRLLNSTVYAFLCKMELRRNKRHSRHIVRISNDSFDERSQKWKPLYREKSIFIGEIVQRSVCLCMFIEYMCDLNRNRHFNWILKLNISHTHWSFEWNQLSCCNSITVEVKNIETTRQRQINVPKQNTNEKHQEDSKKTLEMMLKRL